MTPTHADKLAGALEGLLNGPNNSTQAFGDALEAAHIALTAYRARPQLPEAELVWEEDRNGSWVSGKFLIFEYPPGKWQPSWSGFDIGNSSKPLIQDAKDICQRFHNAILSAIEGRESLPETHSDLLVWEKILNSERAESNGFTYRVAVECDSLFFASMTSDHAYWECYGYKTIEDAKHHCQSHHNDILFLIEGRDKGDGWISVDDRLPEAPLHVLIFSPMTSGVDDAVYQSGYWSGFRDNSVQWLESEVTHWRPLPAPPALGEEVGK